jgi:hypothetical protein
MEAGSVAADTAPLTDSPPSRIGFVIRRTAGVFSMHFHYADFFHSLENTEPSSTEIVHFRNEAEAAMLRVLIKHREKFVPRLYFYPFARLEILNFVVPNLDRRGLVPGSFSIRGPARSPCAEAAEKASTYVP